MSNPVQRPVSIVVLAKYKEVFEPFYNSLIYTSSFQNLIVVCDGSAVTDTFAGPLTPWTRKFIQGPSKFSMAGNGNLGLKAVPADHDILYCGDDVRFLERGTIERLQQTAYSDPKIGILSPKIIGRGSKCQVEATEITEVSPLQMWFPCVYIKRELIDRVGYLDEQFSDFGCDDFDFCVRTLLAGYKLVVDPKITVQHEYSPEGGPTTFVKNIGVEAWRAQEKKAQQKVCEKYKITYDQFLQLANGDLSVLDKSKKTCEEKYNNIIEMTKSPSVPKEDEHTGVACTQENVKEFLSKQSLFIATPVYGGNSLTCNYVHSLLGLVNTCRDLGIGVQTNFMYNESLITRARNVMVKDFKNSKCTHFLFVDCDISFNPNDIILMMLQKEEVIGAPCVKKGLRWDRITRAIKSKPEKEYSGEELEKITGQYVVNFLKDKTPVGIDLGKLLEVRNVGTGIMMVKRHVFEKVAEAFPKNWYLQLLDEFEGRVPVYMYFQAELDDDSKDTNPGGFPDYISEDYGFCKLCRKAGVRVWMAPWLKTTHMGTYIYHGDLKAVSDSGGSLR